MEPSTDINELTTDGTSGLLLLGQEEPRGHAYYIPALGPAPKWAAFLDNLTVRWCCPVRLVATAALTALASWACAMWAGAQEELEESKTPTVYDDYKFVTRKELDRCVPDRRPVQRAHRAAHRTCARRATCVCEGSLGLDHLIGTPVLRAYMHGFFIDMRLYQKVRTAGRKGIPVGQTLTHRRPSTAHTLPAPQAKAVAMPFAYDEYRKQAIEQKIDAANKSRISLQRRLPKVNRAIAERLLNNADGTKDVTPENPLGDPRFRRMFEDADFAVDTESPEYKLLHPAAVRGLALGHGSEGARTMPFG